MKSPKVKRQTVAELKASIRGLKEVNDCLGICYDSVFEDRARIKRDLVSRIEKIETFHRELVATRIENLALCAKNAELANQVLQLAKELSNASGQIAYLRQQTREPTEAPNTFFRRILKRLFS